MILRLRGTPLLINQEHRAGRLHPNGSSSGLLKPTSNIGLTSTLRGNKDRLGQHLVLLQVAELLNNNSLQVVLLNTDFHKDQGISNVLTGSVLATTKSSKRLVLSGQTDPGNNNSSSSSSFNPGLSKVALAILLQGGKTPHTTEGLPPT